MVNDKKMYTVVVSKSPFEAPGHRVQDMKNIRASTYEEAQNIYNKSIKNPQNKIYVRKPNQKTMSQLTGSRIYVKDKSGNYMDYEPVTIGENKWRNTKK